LATRQFVKSLIVGVFLDRDKSRHGFQMRDPSEERSTQVCQ